MYGMFSCKDSSLHQRPKPCVIEARGLSVLVCTVTWNRPLNITHDTATILFQFLQHWMIHWTVNFSIYVNCRHDVYECRKNKLHNPSIPSLTKRNSRKHCNTSASISTSTASSSEQQYSRGGQQDMLPASLKKKLKHENCAHFTTQIELPFMTYEASVVAENIVKRKNTQHQKLETLS